MRAARIFRALGVLTFLAPALVGCSLLALDGFSNGGSTSRDAGSLPDEGSSPFEASTSAPMDASVDGDARPGPFCASLSPKPTVCLDFDDDPPFGTWVVRADHGASVDSSTTTWMSAPRAGYFSRTTPANEAARMTAQYALAGTPSDIVLTADVRVEAADGELDLMTVTFPVGDDSFEVQLSTNEGEVQLEQWRFFADGGNAPIFTTIPRGVPLGTWVHVDLTLHLTDPATATLLLDGSPAPAVGLSLPGDLGSPTIELGDGYVTGSPWAFYIDNFTATLK